MTENNALVAGTNTHKELGRLISLRLIGNFNSKGRHYANEALLGMKSEAFVQWVNFNPGTSIEISSIAQEWQLSELVRLLNSRESYEFKRAQARYRSGRVESFKAAKVIFESKVLDCISAKDPSSAEGINFVNFSNGPLRSLSDMVVKNFPKETNDFLSVHGFSDEVTYTPYSDEAKLNMLCRHQSSASKSLPYPPGVFALVNTSDTSAIEFSLSFGTHLSRSFLKLHDLSSSSSIIVLDSSVVPPGSFRFINAELIEATEPRLAAEFLSVMAEQMAQQSLSTNGPGMVDVSAFSDKYYSEGILKAAESFRALEHGTKKRQSAFL